MPPQESPANRHINEGAGDAGGILLGFASGLVVQSTRASSPDHRGAFQAALNAFVAEERTLEDLGGPAGSTSLQSGLYVHRGQSDRGSLERVMNSGENRIEMQIPRSAWFPRDLRFPHS